MGEEGCDHERNTNHDPENVIDEMATKEVFLDRKGEQRVSRCGTNGSHKADRHLIQNPQLSLYHGRELVHTWLNPLVAPRDARLGEAAVIKMNIAPERR